MKPYLLMAGLVLGINVVAIDAALAYHRHHHCRAPYGCASPSYTSRYGTYPSHTYDPDRRLRAQMRSDFNRGVDFPGGR